MICVPYFGGKDDEHCDAIDKAKAAGFGFLKLTGHPYIDQARCLLAERALAAGAEVVFFIDHDIIFSPEDVWLLAEEAHARMSVVSGLYLVRRQGGPAIVSLDPIPDVIWCYKSGGLYPCSQLPGGFTAIPRAVLEGMQVDTALLGNGTTRVRLWFFNDPLPLERPDGSKESLWTGEDTRFSHRVRQAGFKMFVDTRPKLFHKGAHKFSLEDGDTMKAPSDDLRVEVHSITKQV